MKEEILLKDMFPYLEDMDMAFIQSVDGMIKNIPALKKAQIRSIYELDQNMDSGGLSIIRYVDKNFLVFDFAVAEDEEEPDYLTIYRAFFHFGDEYARPRMVMKDRNRLKKLEKEGYPIQRLKDDALLREEEAEDILQTFFTRLEEYANDVYLYQEDYEDYRKGKISGNDTLTKEEALLEFGFSLEEPEEEEPDFTTVCCEMVPQGWQDSLFFGWPENWREKSLKERSDDTAFESLSWDENLFGETYSIFSYDITEELLEEMKRLAGLGAGAGSLSYLAKTAPHVFFSMWQKGSWCEYALERKEAAEKFLEREREAMIESFCKTEGLTQEELLQNTGLMNNLEMTLHRSMQESVLWN